MHTSISQLLPSGNYLYKNTSQTCLKTLQQNHFTLVIISKYGEQNIICRRSRKYTSF